jgi:O-antigen/teichoic acid export membrane protein
VAEAWAQAPALTGTALVFVLLIQADRLMVSALLPLDALGYYVIASSVAGVTFSFHGAIAVALVPRFTKMLVAGAEDELADLFHLASQFTTLMLAPFTAITVLHGETLLLLWTGNPVAASHASLPLALLSLGAFMLSMTCVSCSLQLAAGLVRFGLIANLLSISALPLAYVAIGQWGASGAAVVWVMMGAIHLVLTPILLHHQLLASELARWYLRDLVVPSAAALVIGFLAWRIFGMPQSRVGMGALLLLTWSAASAAAFAASPLLWRLLRDWYRSGKGLRWGWVP